MASWIDCPSSLWMVETSRMRIVVQGGLQNVEDCGRVSFALLVDGWGPNEPDNKGPCVQAILQALNTHT
jgi:hypothetical protein